MVSAVETRMNYPPSSYYVAIGSLYQHYLLMHIPIK